MNAPERESAVPEYEIHIGAMFGMFTRKGAIKLELVERLDGNERRLSVILAPDEARDQAIGLFEAAVAAELDEAFYAVGQRMGMDEDSAARFLMACREARDAKSKDVPPPTS